MKKKVIVLGGGMVGSLIVKDLAAKHDVTCADINHSLLTELESSLGVKTAYCDFSDTEAIKNVVAGYDLVIGAVPGHLGFNMLKTVIETGKNIVDISFFPEPASPLNELAVEKGVTAVVDCGVAPGMCNIILGYHDSSMKVNAYTCYVGGLPVERRPPFEYKAPFSPIDVIEEYTRPARLKEQGDIVTKEALTEIETLDFPGAGKLEAFNTDGLRSLLETMPHIPDLKEKTLRYPGHAGLMKVLRDTGFFSKEKLEGAGIAPLEVSSRLLFTQWKYQPGEEDFTVMQVDIKGDKEISYYLLDKYDRGSKTMSMARTTGYTCTAVANLLLDDRYDKKGIIPPEELGRSEEAYNYVLDYLEERGVHYSKKGDS